MLVFVFLFILVIVYEIKFCDKDRFNRDYLSVGQTTAVNGAFVILVFFRHVTQYIRLDGVLDASFTTMEKNLNQMIVVTFLFYSGYGIMESINKKGTHYVREIPFKRFFKVFYHMAVAVTLYIITNALLGIRYDFKRILLAFTGWTGIGNSCWYIFAVFVLYIITYLSFMIFRKNNYAATFSVTLMIVAFVVWMMYMERPKYCYNTVILYACGMWYSLFRKYTDRIIMKKDTVYLSVVAIAVSVYYFMYLKKDEGIEWYSGWGIMFMGLILLATMKADIGNKILRWFGSHVFSIYILQRLPMIVLKEIGLADKHKYAFVVISFFISLALAVVFDAVLARVDSLIFRPAKKLESVSSAS